MNNGCSVLVCSCDKYEDAWNPFFALFNKYWNNCPYPVYLNTESKQFKGYENIKVKSLNCSPRRGKSWSKRLKNALKEIKSPFVIIMLEDFFLLSDVNQDMVEKCLKRMQEDPDIATICFERLGNKNEKEALFDIFVERKKGSKYRLNCQAGIWRRDVLIKCLRNFESPWEFEEFGNMRSNGINEKFYYQIKDSDPIFDYNVERATGYGLYRGKWLKSNANLFEEHGIKADFTNLGFFTNKSKSENKKRSGLEKLKFYSKNPSELFKTIKAVSVKKYKNFYWNIEKRRYRKYISK